VTGAEKEALKALGDTRVIHEDNHLLVVDKPAGLLSQSASAGDDNLVERAKAYIKLKHQKPGNVYLGLVHRLDRNVSGVIILAKTSKAASRLTKAFKDRALEKRYLALVEGTGHEARELVHKLVPRPQGRGVMEGAEGKRASLSFHILGESSDRSLLEVHLHTGRKHQIRAQLALAGMPLVGDPLYGQRSQDMRRPALLAATITLDHPVGGDTMRFRSAIPRDLRRALSGHNLLHAALRLLGDE
jgi:23S rRNA pseudouridine1911/1915/1917 synthase